MPGQVEILINGVIGNALHYSSPKRRQTPSRNKYKQDSRECSLQVTFLTQYFTGE